MAKNKQKNTNTVRRLSAVRLDDLETFEPLTTNQKKAFSEYDKGQHLCLQGLAGTGKTFTSLYLALEEVLDPSTKFNKIYLVRSVVPTREMGFLPGSEQEKVAVYEAPYKATCRELFSCADAYERLKDQGSIEFISTSYIRGLNITNAIVVIDECQNLTFHELDSVITRLGKHAKIIISGDYRQTDLSKSSERIGLLNFNKILKQMKEVSFIEFTEDDIVRGDFLKSYIIKKTKLGYAS